MPDIQSVVLVVCGCLWKEVREVGSHVLPVCEIWFGPPSCITFGTHHTLDILVT